MKTPLFLLFFIAFSSLQGQNTFHRYMDGGAHTHCHHSVIAPDDGTIITGYTEVNGVSEQYVSRMDCTGKLLWTKTLFQSSSIGNISPRILITSDDHIIITGNAGAYQAYDPVVTKLDSSGVILWQKVMPGFRDDLIEGITEAANGDLILAGTTNSYGQDATQPQLAFRDVFLMRLESDGDFLWGRTFGNPNTIDNATDVIETTDGGIALTGRYIHTEAFYIMLLKTDSNGILDFIKVYGDSNHRNYGYSIIQNSAGDFYLGGSTTLMKNNHTDFPDACLIKTNSSGQLQWARSYHGTNSDRSESASSVIATQDGGFAMSMPTMSYPTVGFVPNKHVILKTDAMGHLQMARAYNQGSSHYAFLARPTSSSGYTMSGFTTDSTATFSPVIIRMDSNFSAGCKEFDLLAQTIEENPSFVEAVPQVNVSTGGSMETFNYQDSAIFTEYIICDSIVDTCTWVSSDTSTTDTTDTGTVVIDFSHKISQYELYPNPASNRVTISTHHNFSGKAEIRIIDALGREVYYGLIVQETTRLDISDWENGMYLVRISNDWGTETRKLLVNKQ